MLNARHHPWGEALGHPRPMTGPSRFRRKRTSKDFMLAPYPPVTGSTHPLPFEKLSPVDFERLCYALVERAGYISLEHLGAAGRDEGCDILAFRPGERVVFQCKRYPR